ncbi:VOC family protein [Chryseolinea lacunae]|uniref:VOC domain-containing protein n=1 Tax=Chryseolinea lacunae TaxID=2801331 RepID=A0ABS1KZ81_9BACT|nr:VOC family protein [Chryseolinea lacunae]MBL0744768.1 hypothetical protein [Chryseolinea lacunae]
MEASMLHSAVPVIASDDVRKSMAYYVDVLGFANDFEYGDPVTYGGVNWGEVEVYFTYDPGLCTVLRESEYHAEIFIWVIDANALYEEHRTRGAEIIEALNDRPWNARQYVVRDIHGYHLKFAQPT